MKFYDNTKLKAHRQCPRKYFYSHVLHMNREGFKGALAFGLAWHNAQDVMWRLIHENPKVRNEELLSESFRAWHKTWTEEGGPAVSDFNANPDLFKEYAFKARNPGVAMGMLQGYIDKRRPYIQDRLQLMHIELPFAIPINEGGDIWYCGRLDKVAKDDMGVWIYDHKTTTNYRIHGYFGPSFIDSFSPDTQMEGYAFFGVTNWGPTFQGIKVDAALVHKDVHDGFSEIPVIRGDEPLEQWLWEVQTRISQIEQDEVIIQELRESGGGESFMPAFPRNPESCWDFNQPCAFLDFCKGWDNPLRRYDEQGTPDGFVEKVWNPFDVNKIEQLGLTDGEEGK